MINVLEFFDHHTILAFVAIWLTGRCCIEFITLFKLPFRVFMVSKAGWPPEYLDADGDTHHKREQSSIEEAA